jgi:uncharacterized phage-like protein YoqJ
MIWAATGHRPLKLGGFTAFAQGKLMGFALREIENMASADASLKLICGMADGWDMAVASACVDSAIPFIAAVPFHGQSDLWPVETQRRYFKLLKEAESVTVVCAGTYDAWKMQARNQWMVQRADKILALHDGSKGGTWNCIKYAIEQKKEVVNLWGKWEKFNA